jgi:hypothetical protein
MTCTGRVLEWFWEKIYASHVVVWMQLIIMKYFEDPVSG